MDGFEVCLLESRPHLVLIEESFDLARGVHADIIVAIERNECKRLLAVDPLSSESVFDGFDGLTMVSQPVKMKVIGAEHLPHLVGRLAGCASLDSAQA